MPSPRRSDAGARTTGPRRFDSSGKAWAGAGGPNSAVSTTRVPVASLRGCTGSHDRERLGAVGGCSDRPLVLDGYFPGQPQFECWLRRRVLSTAGEPIGPSFIGDTPVADLGDDIDGHHYPAPQARHSIPQGGLARRREHGRGSPARAWDRRRPSNDSGNTASPDAADQLGRQRLCVNGLPRSCRWPGRLVLCPHQHLRLRDPDADCNVQHGWYRHRQQRHNPWQ